MIPSPAALVPPSLCVIAFVRASSSHNRVYNSPLTCGRGRMSVVYPNVRACVRACVRTCPPCAAVAARMSMGQTDGCAGVNHKTTKRQTTTPARITHLFAHDVSEQRLDQAK